MPEAKLTQDDLLRNIGNLVWQLWSMEKELYAIKRTQSGVGSEHQHSDQEREEGQVKEEQD